jgi:AcrR family transcriptional regulator
MRTRQYEKRLRAKAAEETRRRILDAVYQRLCEAPTEPVSIEQVSRMAQVSRSTVYLVFGSRAGLFDALDDDLRGRGGFDRVAAASHELDARKGLFASIRAAVPVFAQHRDVLRVLYARSQLDPDAVGGAVQRMGETRSAGIAWHARRLAEQGALRPDVTETEAAHLLWSLTGFETFDQLYTGGALPKDVVADLLVTIVERAVCS